MLQYLLARAKCVADRTMGQKGQGMVEYALILAFVVVVAVAITNGDIRKQVTNIFTGVGTALTDAQKTN